MLWLDDRRKGGAMIGFRLRELSRTEGRLMMLVGLLILATTWVASIGRGPAVHLALFVVVILIYTCLYGLAFRALRVAQMPGRRIGFYAGVIGVELVCIAIVIGAHSWLA